MLSINATRFYSSSGENACAATTTLFMLQVMMNPFYQHNTKIQLPVFDKKVMVAGRKHLLN
jgi:hypothetical protein